MSGNLEWIGIRAKSGGIESIDSVIAIEGQGLEGDKITKKKIKKKASYIDAKRAYLCYLVASTRARPI